MRNWSIKYKITSLSLFIFFLFMLWNSALLLLQAKWLDSISYLGASFMLLSIILVPEIFFLSIREGMSVYQSVLSQRAWVQKLSLIGVVLMWVFFVLKLLIKITEILS